MRAAIFAATVFLVGCPSGKADVPHDADNKALRVRVAQAEVRRGAGVQELVELAQDKGARELALRGLGRSGATEQLERLGGSAGIGLAASLDDLTRPAAQLDMEALGRAGDAAGQAVLARCVATNPACGVALGRYGRRKLALSAETRAAVVAATSGSDASARYAAVYALQREHQPPTDDAVNAALAVRIGDDNPETRAIAIAALAKRKAVAAARKAIEDSLRDRDWRVAVEAVRALVGADDAGRALVAGALQRRWAVLVKGNASEAHVVIEGLRQLIGKPLADPAPIAQLAATAAADQTVPELTRGWIECLARVVAPSPQAVDAIAHCGLPDHLRLPLLGELVNANVGDASVRRAALRILLAHEDPRVRAAGIGALAATWKDGDAKAQATIVGTIAAAFAAKSPIVAGAAIDAAPAIYDALGANNPLQPALDSALVSRAASETDLELAASLYELIGKRALAAGADACRAGLSGHPVRARAAAECLRALGQGVTTPALGPGTPPPVDVASVIGAKLRWHLATTRGEIVIELRPEVAPWAVATVVALTRRGFYDGIEFHRVVPNFVVQGGDPTMSGWGGPGFTIPAEPASSADGAGFVAGGVGIADAGRDSGGSQWFIMHSRAPHLDGRYTWFGSVISGQKSADALLIGDRVVRATIEQL